MRKQALVHLHALCTLLREYLQNSEEASVGAIDPDSAPTGPAAIHRPKGEHRKAVNALATEIATAVDGGGHDCLPDGGPDTPGSQRCRQDPETDTTSTGASAGSPAEGG